MTLKKGLISVLVIGAIYFLVSFLLSKLFGYTFQWKIRLITGLIFGIIMLLIGWINQRIKASRKNKYN